MALDTQSELLAGRYRKLRTIGVGGMARVHLAEDERLGRRVAVKQLHADSPEDAALRFEREAKVGASLNHPNLVSIYDIATDGESVLIVMEFVDGETLHDRIERGSVAPDRVARIVRDVAAGLDHAHAHGVIHRDVKPANILIRHDGMAKLADLGIASAAQRTSITRSGIVLGTAAYMAPEQLDGGAAGPRTDVYALAAVAFEALSGEKARSGKTPVEIAHDVVNGPPPDLERAWDGAPPAAADALARGMARYPGDRPSSAGELATLLEDALRPRRTVRVGAAPAPAPTVPTAPLLTRAESRPPRRWLPVALAVLVGALILAAGVAALTGGDDGGPDAARQSTPTADAGRDRSQAEPAEDGQDGTDSDSVESAEPAPVPAPAPTPEATTEDPVTLNDEGFALMQEGRYDEAIPLLERAVSQYPEDSQDLSYGYALYNLGRSLRLAGRPEEAVPILERRLQIPDQTETVRQELEAARSEAG